jgi:hypothetical protein
VARSIGDSSVVRFIGDIADGARRMKYRFSTLHREESVLLTSAISMRM